MKALSFPASVFSIVWFMTVLVAGAASPSVTTTNPTAITTNSATLKGTANPNGLATSAYFEWGTTTNYGSLTAPQSLGAGSSPVAVQANLSSLLTDTNYHYRLVASNASGIAFGRDVIVTPTLLLYLYAGEIWSYGFHDLPFAGLLPSSTVNPGFSRSILSLVPGSFSPDGAFLFELIQNSTNGGGVAITVTQSVPPNNGSFA
jgi:hypothetical protein